MIISLKTVNSNNPKTQKFSQKFWDAIQTELVKPSIHPVLVGDSIRLYLKFNSQVIGVKFDPKIITFPDEFFATHPWKVTLCQGWNDKKLTKIVKSLNIFTNQDFEEAHADDYTTIYIAIVVGCPKSTDIDVVVVVDQSLNGSPKQLTEAALESLRSRLADIGYDSHVDPEKHRDPLDITYVYLDDLANMGISPNKVLKGGKGKETTAMVLETHSNHAQLTETVEFLKTAGLTPIPYTPDLLLDKLHDIVQYFFKRVFVNRMSVDSSKEYTKWCHMRLSRCYEFSDMQHIMNHHCFDEAHVESHRLAQWRNFMKSIVMKLIQMLGFYSKQKTVYTKEELVNEVVQMFPQNPKYGDAARYYLFRGKEGSPYVKFIKELLTAYVDIGMSCGSLDEPTTIGTYNDLKGYQSSLGLVMLQEFLESPISPTDKFLREWEAHFGSKLKDSIVGDQFMLSTGSIPSMADCIKHHIVDVPQRSSEWHAWMKYYTCGRNQGDIKDTHQGKYNLIRGCMLEALVLWILQINMSLILGPLGLAHWTFFEVGLLVKTKTPGAKGMAPDGLLICNDANGTDESSVESSSNPTNSCCSLIPIEIKGLKGLPGMDGFSKSSYNRGLTLAKRQVSTIQSIISADKVRIPKGLVILCAINKSVLHWECHIVDF